MSGAESRCATVKARSGSAAVATMSAPRAGKDVAFLKQCDEIIRTPDLW